MKYVLWVIFYNNVRQGMLALIVDVGYEAEWLYSSITDDSINGRELISRYGPSGSPMRAIELIKNR